MTQKFWSHIKVVSMWETGIGKIKTLSEYYMDSLIPNWNALFLASSVSLSKWHKLSKAKKIPLVLNGTSIEAVKSL